MSVQFKEESSEKNEMKKHSKQKQNCHKERKNQMENLITLSQASGCDCCWRRTAVLDDESISFNPVSSPHHSEQRQKGEV